jgi:hypothetical protein
MTVHKTTRTECETDQPSIRLIFWPIVSILHSHSLLTPSTMARGTNTPRWNSSSAHGKALEARITELHHGGQLIDGETSFQEVLDGVPELAMYSRDALRRAAKVIAARFGVNLAMNGTFCSGRRSTLADLVLADRPIDPQRSISRWPQSPCCSSCGCCCSCCRRSSYGGPGHSFASAPAASPSSHAGPSLDYSEVDVRPASVGFEGSGLVDNGSSRGCGGGG